MWRTAAGARVGFYGGGDSKGHPVGPPE